MFIGVPKTGSTSIHNYFRDAMLGMVVVDDEGNVVPNRARHLGNIETHNCTINPVDGDDYLFNDSGIHIENGEIQYSQVPNLKHSTIKRAIENVPGIEGFTFFLFVRNPYEIPISNYFHMKRSYEEAIERLGNDNGNDWVKRCIEFREKYSHLSDEEAFGLFTSETYAFEHGSKSLFQKYLKYGHKTIFGKRETLQKDFTSIMNGLHNDSKPHELPYDNASSIKFHTHLLTDEFTKRFYYHFEYDFLKYGYVK